MHLQRINKSHEKLDDGNTENQSKTDPKPSPEILPPETRQAATIKLSVPR